MLNLKKFIFILPILVFSCTTDYSGTYSVCQGDNPSKEGCHFIILNNNGSFLYSNPFAISGNQETTGKWTIENDSLVLNNSIQRFFIRTSKSNKSISDSLTLRIRNVFKDQYSDCSNATVFTNQTDSFITNKNGIVTLSRKALDSIRIEYVGCFKEWIQLSESISETDSIEISCNNEAIGQIEMNNRKWRLENDTIFVDHEKTTLDKLVKRKN